MIVDTDNLRDHELDINWINRRVDLARNCGSEVIKQAWLDVYRILSSAEIVTVAGLDLYDKTVIVKELQKVRNDWANATWGRVLDRTDVYALAIAFLGN